MKVIHARRMTDKIAEAITNAAEQGREIERIEVTPDEFDRLLNELAGQVLYGTTVRASGITGEAKVTGRGYRAAIFCGVQIQDYEGEK